MTRVAPTVTEAGDRDHVQVILIDDPLEMDINDSSSPAWHPNGQQPRLHILLLQRFFQQRIVIEIIPAAWGSIRLASQET
jgi:hypothetical protein